MLRNMPLRRLGLATLLGLALLHGPVALADELNLGLEPFFQPRTLANAFKSVRDFLGDQTGKKIVASTAPGYEQFLRQILKSDYDILLTGPSIGLLAEKHAGYRPIFRCAGSLKVDLVVQKDSPYQTAADLAGQAVALPDSLVIDSMLAEEFFRPPFTARNISISFKHNDFSNNATLMMLRGDAAAAAVNHDAMLLMSPQIQDDLRVIAQSKTYGNMLVLVHPRIDAATGSRLRDAIIHFLTITDPRRNLFTQVCRPSDKLLTEQEARQLAPYVTEMQRRLGL